MKGATIYYQHHPSSKWIKEGNSLIKREDKKIPSRNILQNEHFHVMSYTRLSGGKGVLYFTSAPFPSTSAESGSSSQKQSSFAAVPPPTAAWWLGACHGVPGWDSQPCSGSPPPTSGCYTAGGLWANLSIWVAYSGPKQLSKTVLGLSPTCPGSLPRSRASGPPPPSIPFAPHRGAGTLERLCSSSYTVTLISQGPPCLLTAPEPF